MNNCNLNKMFNMILNMNKGSYPSSSLIVVKIHEAPHVTLLPNHLSVRGIQELPGEPQSKLQVVTRYKKTKN